MSKNNMVLINKDMLEVMKEIPDNTIDLIVTDPPYRVTSRGNAGTSGGMMTKKQSMKGKIFKHNDINIEDYAPELFRVLKEGSHLYIMTNHINLTKMLNVLQDTGFHFIKSLIWMKDNKIMGRFYMSQFEYILFFRKGKAIQINNCGTSDILNFPNTKQKGEDGKNLHDTEKPVGLMEILVTNSSQEGEVVLDPFMGIGSTGVAALNNGRSFIGIELDEKYFNVAKARLEEVINE